MRKEKVTGKAAITAGVKNGQGNEVESFKEGPVAHETISLDGQIAWVEVGLGMTVKLRPQYWMARVDVKVRIPCAPDKVDETYTKAKTFVAERVGREVRRITGSPAKEASPKRKGA